MFQLFSISLLVYVASCPRGRVSPSDAHPFAAPASLPRSFGSRDFLSSRLASFRDCKFLDVGLKGAETFRGRAAVAVSHSVTRTLTRTLPESIFRLSAGRPLDTRTLERRYLFADTRYHRVAFQPLSKVGFFYALFVILSP